MAGMMVAGKWITDEKEQNQNVDFHEISTTFRDRV
ncbi:glutathione-dependent reductase, partial [Chroococcidiopsis cubana CCALA 043]